MWTLNADRRQPGDLNHQIEEILSGLTKDLEVWRDLCSRFSGCILAGFFMVGGNEGHDLSPATLKLLADRGLSLSLDIYSGGDEDDGEV